MALRKVCRVGNDILRKVSKQVENFDDGLWELLDDMRDTMYQNDGAGLAAPQVGVLKRAVIMDINGYFLELINPEITEVSGEAIEKEGCLSVGKEYRRVKRPTQVTVKAQDRFGNKVVITGENYLARCICHEVDHLNGILFIDIAEPDQEEPK